MNQLMRFEDLREWLVSKVNDSVEIVGEDELILGFIRKLDAARSATGAPPVWAWALEEGATAWQDAALAHLKVVSVLMSPQDVLRVQNFINDSRMKSLPVEEKATDRPDWARLARCRGRRYLIVPI